MQEEYFEPTNRDIVPILGDFLHTGHDDRHNTKQIGSQVADSQEAALEPNLDKVQVEAGTKNEEDINLLQVTTYANMLTHNDLAQLCKELNVEENASSLIALNEIQSEAQLI